MTENEKRLLELANRLVDISYQEWVKLSHLVEMVFDAKKREAERQLHLPAVSEQDLMQL